MREKKDLWSTFEVSEALESDQFELGSPCINIVAGDIKILSCSDIHVVSLSLRDATVFQVNRLHTERMHIEHHGSLLVCR
jgi:hypothetical protein